MKGHLEVEDGGAVLFVRVDGGPHSLFGLDIANQLEELVDRVDRDPSVHAVVFTGTHPENQFAYEASPERSARPLRSARRFWGESTALTAPHDGDEPSRIQEAVVIFA